MVMPSKELQKAIKQFRALKDEDLTCPSCNRTKAYFPVKSFGAAMRAVAEDLCYFENGAHQEWQTAHSSRQP